MSKEVTKVEEFEPPKSQEEESVIVIETEDGVRYVFSYEEELVKHDKMRFSHRIYPEKTTEEYRNDGNYRLPESVEDYITEHYGSISYIDGMIDAAEKNHSRSVQLNG